MQIEFSGTCNWWEVGGGLAGNNTRTRFEKNQNFPQECVKGDFWFLGRMMPKKGLFFIYSFSQQIFLSTYDMILYDMIWPMIKYCTPNRVITVSAHYGRHSSTRCLLRLHTKNHAHPSSHYSALEIRTASEYLEWAGKGDREHTHCLKKEEN